MPLRLGIPEIRENLSSSERIELILDLTRRLERIEELMQGAKNRREHPDSDTCVARFDDWQLDSLTSH